MQRSAAPETGLSAPTILDNHANPVCIDMTIAASYPLFRSCWPEVCRNADAVGERAGDRVSSLRILSLPAASRKARIPARSLACGRRCRPAYEIPLFTRYAIKARR
jgi:hypothetical protein